MYYNILYSDLECNKNKLFQYDTRLLAKISWKKIKSRVLIEQISHDFSENSDLNLNFDLNMF